MPQHNMGTTAQAIKNCFFIFIFKDFLSLLFYFELRTCIQNVLIKELYDLSITGK